MANFGGSAFWSPWSVCEILLWPMDYGYPRMICSFQAASNFLECTTPKTD